MYDEEFLSAVKDIDAVVDASREDQIAVTQEFLKIESYNQITRHLFSQGHQGIRRSSHAPHPAFLRHDGGLRRMELCARLCDRTPVRGRTS
ncbi:MAG: hypothetical protein LBS00_09400 [Synergistaceae bacterium]|jgi:hypothetical protein|nr:hypothetical protein [Synergistaceae bacterium]